MIKECDINLIKSKNTESLQMVSKRLKTHYLRSDEQFFENQIYHSIFETRNLTKQCARKYQNM